MDIRDANCWHTATETEAGDLVVSTARHLWEQQAWRRDRARRGLSLFHGKECTALYGRNFGNGDTFGEDANATRWGYGICETAQAKIASRMRPKPTVLTTGGDYQLRLQAKKVSQYLLAWLHQAQGQFSDAWELMEQVFMDSTYWEFGAVKVYADVARKRIAYERTYPWELLVDLDAAHEGNPRELFHVYRGSRRRIMAAYGDTPLRKEQIKGASSKLADALNEFENAKTTPTSDLIDVYEAWILPDGEDCPGRHVIAIDSQLGGVCLVDDEWEREEFPFIRVLWQRDPIGWFGMPLIELTAGQAKGNEVLQRIAENMRANAGGYLDVVEGAYDDAELTSNDSMKVIVRKSANHPKAEVKMPPIFNPQTLEAFQLHKREVHDNTGFSEMSTQGRKEPGVESGTAIRTVNDLQDQRFLPKSRRYETAVGELGKHTLACTRELVDAGINPAVFLPGGSYLEEIDWAEIELPEDMYEVRIEPSSSSSDTLAGRLSTLQELSTNGLISPESFKKAALSLNPDLEALSKREQAQTRYLERLIARFQRSEPNEPGVFEPPDPIMNLGAAIAQMSDAYIEMLDDEAPEYMRELPRKWIQMADKILAPPPAPPAPTDPTMGGEPQLMGPPGGSVLPPSAPPPGAGPPMPMM